jgi:hypothetical protein
MSGARSEQLCRVGKDEGKREIIWASTAGAYLYLRNIETRQIFRDSEP